MKKLNRKLIPAFAMLLLSAVLMSTASFAWFSANGTVSASGMTISATAPAALWIKNSQSKWDVTASFTNTKTAISPVTDDIAATTNANTAAAGENWLFHALNAAGRAMIDQNGLINGQPVTSTTIGEGQDAKTIAVAEPLETDTTNYANANYVKQDFQLRLEGQKGTTAATTELVDIKAKVTISTSATSVDAIWKALRVAVVCTAVADTGENAVNFSNGGYAIFAPAGTESFTKDAPLVLTAPAEASRKETVENKEVASAAFLTIAAQEEVNVYVYVWFEGNDTDCTNNNSKFNVPYSISVDFYADEINNANKD